MMEQDHLESLNPLSYSIDFDLTPNISPLKAIAGRYMLR